MKFPHYPRTLHLADSGGGTSKHHCAFAEVAGQHLAIEEKVDGGHCGLGFDPQAELLAHIAAAGGHWRARDPLLNRAEADLEAGLETGLDRI